MALQALASVLAEPVGAGLMENDSTAADDVNLSAAAYLLSRVGSVLGNESVDPAISEVSLTLSSHTNTGFGTGPPTHLCSVHL